MGLLTFWVKSFNFDKTSLDNIIEHFLSQKFSESRDKRQKLPRSVSARLIRVTHKFVFILFVQYKSQSSFFILNVKSLIIVVL